MAWRVEVEKSAEWAVRLLSESVSLGSGQKWMAVLRFRFSGSHGC